MNRIIKISVFFIILLLLLSTTAIAANDENTIQDTASFIDEIKTLGSKALKTAFADLKSIFSASIKCFVIAILCVIADINNSSRKTVFMVGSSAILAVVINDYCSVINAGARTIEQVTAAVKTILPAITTAAITTGTTGTAYIGVIFVSDVICTLISKVMLPIVFTYTVLAFISSLNSKNGISSISDTVYKTVTGAIKVILGLYIAYIMTGTLFAKSGTLVTVKTVKLLSGSIPVVGSVIADAAETVIAGAVSLKSMLGVTGIITIAGICLTPLITITLQNFSFKLVSILIELAGGNEYALLMANISKAFTMIIGMVGSCCFMLMTGIYAMAMVTTA